MNALDRLNLIDDIKTKASYRAEAAGLENESDLLTELRLDLAGGCGVSLVGSFSEESDFLAGQVEPYLLPEAPASMEEVYVEERIDNRSYAGICDESGALPAAYCSDPVSEGGNGMGIHFTYAGCAVWTDYLYTHTA